MILSSLPATRGFIQSLVNYKFLYPAAEKIFESSSNVDSAVRALSLIGVSNLSGILLLFGAGILIYFNKKNNSIILSILFLGAISTYSRSVF